MKVIQFGYGKMGQFICRELKKNDNVTEISVYDRIFDNSFVEDGVKFLSEFDEKDISSYDCAFIATPADSHCEVIEKLINNGMKKIFVEKPAVLNNREYEIIDNIRDGCTIAIGYILRQSKPIIAMKNMLSDLTAEGYYPKKIDIVYQKFLPSYLEARAQGDFGVFEETVHVWDLLLNFLGLNKYDVSLENKNLEQDPERKNRTIFAKLNYSLKSKENTVSLDILSSFKAEKRKREFMFEFVNLKGNKRNVFVSFDTPEEYDYIKITDENGNELYSDKCSSNLKLEYQMNEVFRYFKTGEKGNLALFEESKIINDMLEKVL